MKKLLLSIFITFSMVSIVSAHSLWINTFESTTHKPGHVMVSLGWGHALPMDDILNSPNGSVQMESFELIDPKLKKTTLVLPSSKPSKAIVESESFDLFPGDLAVQKIAFKKDSAQGVYQFAFASKPTFFTQYINKKGKSCVLTKPKNEIKDIDKVLMSVKFSAFAKSYATLGKWTNPEPLGHALEIIPRTDLSNVRVGDLVEVDVLFYGKPLSANAKSIDYITAHSASFGQSDGFMLFSYIMEGKAQFRVQSRGEWMISVNHKDDVTKDGPLKDLVGKAEQVYHSASLTFNVK